VQDRELTAVVLAGVHDWGACALNHAVIRPLAPIANTPMVGFALRALSEAGVRRAALCTNGHGAAFREALGDGSAYGLSLVIRDEGMPRGPAGCVKDAYEYLGGDCVVIESTLAPQFDLGEMIHDHRATGAALTIASRKSGMEGAEQYAPIGVYVFSPEVIAGIAPRGFVDVKENVLPTLYREGKRVDVFVAPRPAPRLQGVASYFSLNEWAVKWAVRGGFELDGYALEGSSLVHMDAEIDPSARLMGPVVVGPGARIRAGAIVVGPTSIGRNAIVGQDAVVSRSGVWDDAVVGQGAHVDRCIVGKGARVTESARLFNSVCVPEEPKKSRFAIRSFRSRQATTAPVRDEAVSAPRRRQAV
jgi:NDP-sugar pyrophosphorylase family protein